MAAVKKDIKGYIKNSTLFDSKTKKLYFRILEDVEDYEYSYEYVDAPAAMGDTHKSSCSYSIKGYNFDYHHITGDGGIFSGVFTVEHEDQKEIIAEYSQFAEMAKRFGKNIKVVQQTGLLTQIVGLYDATVKIRHYHNFFGILNAFTFGQCIMTDDGGKVEPVGFDF